MRLYCLITFIGLALSAAVWGEQSLTARQVIDRIQVHTGASLPADTVDTFKGGDPDTRVKGIAVTMMATLDVLERAAATGKNLVITHEPTFYNHRDATKELEEQNDRVLAAKKKFIADHGLVIWRFHDGWHARKPDGILLGMTEALGWQKYQNAAEPQLFVLPETSIDSLAAEVKRKLDIRVLRAVGDPKLRVSKIGFLPGAAGSEEQIKMLERDDVEALLIGETPEWETVEYVADAATEGRHKALLILSHIPSEQAGMEECAHWLSSFIAEVPIAFVAAKQPFWQPGR